MKFRKLTYGKMKEFKSTNGAARLVDGRGFFIGPVPEKGRDNLDIAEVHCTASQVMEEQEAWARLFAAAPDLLVHAEWVLRLMGTDHQTGKKELKQHVNALWEAIHAAKGV